MKLANSAREDLFRNPPVGDEGDGDVERAPPPPAQASTSDDDVPQSLLDAALSGDDHAYQSVMLEGSEAQRQTLLRHFQAMATVSSVPAAPVPTKTAAAPSPTSAPTPNVGSRRPTFGGGPSSNDPTPAPVAAVQPQALPSPPSVRSPSPVQPVAAPAPSTVPVEQPGSRRPRFGGAPASDRTVSTSGNASASVPSGAGVAVQPPAPSVGNRPRFGGAASPSPSPTTGSTPTAAPSVNPSAGPRRSGGFQGTGMGSAPMVHKEDDVVDEGSHAMGGGANRSSPAPTVRPTSTPSSHGRFQGAGMGQGPVMRSNDEEAVPSQSVKLTRQGLDVRLDRLIDMVGLRLGKSVDELKAIKAQAVLNPQEIQTEYERLYNEQVQLRQTQFATLQKAQQAHPDHVVYLHIKDDHQHLVSLPRERAEKEGWMVFDGQIARTVPYESTPFGPPSTLFAPANVEIVQTDDAAFGDDEPSEPENVAAVDVVPSAAPERARSLRP